MTAVPVLERQPTPAEREQPPLAAEIAYVRALLEAYRNDEPAPPRTGSDPETDRPQGVERSLQGLTLAIEAADGFEPAVDRLTRLLGLTAFERQVVLLAAAVELDGEVAALTASLQGGEPRPTFGLALAAIPGAHWDALAPGSPLRRWRLVEPAAGPTLASRPLRLDERVLHYLAGLPAEDERLEGIAGISLASPPLAPSQEDVVLELARTVAAAGAPALMRLDGDDVDARLDAAARLAAELGRLPLVVHAGALPAPGPDLARLARLVDREAILVGGLPVVDSEDGAEAVVAAFLEALEAPLVVLVGEHAERTGGRAALHRSVRLPAPAEQRAQWKEALGEPLASALADTVEEVAQHYRLGAAAVDGLARELNALAPDDQDAPQALRRLCRQRARVRLDGLAERIEPAATWDDLVLPPGQTELLRQIVLQVRHRTQVYERWGFGARTSRGLGVTALFAGESGTGKTLAAEVMAGELGFDLYRVDLAGTVSKWLGETEKNLRRVFDAAEAGGAMLLFDEADALFGKRGDVKDAHDRYANLEVAYLLQRMESYRGLAILTTNLRSNVDRAFLRRLRFVVQFPFPDEAQRAEIWRRAFPPPTPLEVEPERLARLTVTGGSIRAIALSAAFAAAEDGTPVTRAHVLHAARIEYAKSERALTDTETAGLR